MKPSLKNSNEEQHEKGIVTSFEFIFSSTFSPVSIAVFSINCISPIALLVDVASFLILLSALITANTSNGSTLYSVAYS